MKPIGPSISDPQHTPRALSITPSRRAPWLPPPLVNPVSAVKVVLAQPGLIAGRPAAPPQLQVGRHPTPIQPERPRYAGVPVLAWARSSGDRAAAGSPGCGVDGLGAAGMGTKRLLPPIIPPTSLGILRAKTVATPARPASPRLEHPHRRPLPPAMPQTLHPCCFRGPSCQFTTGLARREFSGRQLRLRGGSPATYVIGLPRARSMAWQLWPKAWRRCT